MPVPKASQTDLRPGVPGATTSRATSSASITWQPRSANTFITDDLPTAIDPVSPTFIIPGGLGPHFTDWLWPGAGLCYDPRRNFAACRVFFINIATVRRPTPPGTGVSFPATRFASAG